MRDYQACARAHCEAVASGKAGNKRVFLMMGPYTHFNAETFFPPCVFHCTAARALTHATTTTTTTTAGRYAR